VGGGRVNKWARALYSPVGRLVRVDAVTTFTAVGGHDTYTPLHFVYKKSARRTSNFKHNPAVDQPTAPLLKQPITKSPAQRAPAKIQHGF
jgi:hypothetical protein